MLVFFFQGIHKTDKIKGKQQAGIKFPNFGGLPSLGFYFSQLNVGKNSSHNDS